MKQKLIVLMIAGVMMCGYAQARIFGEKESPDEQRKEIRMEHNEILKIMFEESPELKKKVKNAPGYATFSAVNVNLLLLATTRGKGVVMDNKTGKEIFMKITSIGGGIGAGIKDLRALLIFNDPDALKEFVNSGWQFGGQADASLKSGDQGKEIGESVSVAADQEGGTNTALSKGLGNATQAKTAIEVYRFTEEGISLQATIAGTKFSKDEELN